MKKCPFCNSASLDTETTCGVCGEGLAHVRDQSVGEIQQELGADVDKANRALRINRTHGMVLLGIIAVILVSGIVVMLYSPILFPFGLFLVVVGLSVLTLLLGLGGYGEHGGGGGKSGVGGWGRESDYPPKERGDEE